jgi:MFS family permease
VRLPRILEPLRHRDFRLLWAGQSVSIFGNFIHGVALPFQILALGGGALEIGLWGAILSVATIVFLLLGGAIADRFSRRTIILANDFASGLVVAAVATLSAAGALRIEHLYAEAFLFGATHSFFEPALNALIPDLVPADVLQSGNAIRGMSRQIALIGGPVVGGALAAVGLPLAFGADAASFFASFAALWLARPPRRDSAGAAPLLRQIREGLAYTFSVPWLWIFIFAWAIVVLGTFGPLNVAVPIFVRDVLRGDARLYGTITAAVGVGDIVTGLLLARFRVRRLGIAICLFGILGGLALIGMGLVPMVSATLAFAAVFGAQFVGVGVLWTTAVQKHVPRDLLGRVTSIDFFGGSLLLPFAPVIFAAVVAAFGPAAALVLGGAMAVAITAFLLLVPSIRELE